MYIFKLFNDFPEQVLTLGLLSWMSYEKETNVKDKLWYQIFDIHLFLTERDIKQR